jgi:hypothetical protein
MDADRGVVIPALAGIQMLRDTAFGSHTKARSHEVTWLTSLSRAPILRTTMYWIRWYGKEQNG